MTGAIDPEAIAGELLRARSSRSILSAPYTRRLPGFDLTAAYAVAAAIVRRRLAEGRTTVGQKVGFANKAVWRVFKLSSLVWAPMYDDTVRDAADGRASVSMAAMCSPRIEPEIVFKLRTPPGAGLDAPGALEAVEWLALGFEIIDCPFADWTFQPADFVAAFGFHAGLVIGRPQRVEASSIPRLVEILPRFTVELLRDGAVVEEGSGRNTLRSPALCLAELAAAMTRDRSAHPLAAGNLVSSGTLTEARPIAAGERWSARVEGIDLPELTVEVRA